ncbi:MAG: hypothetical protein IJ691_10920 [Lachnospiraceae bacterium]|nr:hypothetical protein [Lachnospiraceae bacterium]
MSGYRAAKKIVSVLLVGVIAISSVCSCGKRNPQPTVDEEPSEIDPEINVTIIDDTELESDAVNEDILNGYVQDAYSIVCSSIAHRLEKEGFVADFGYAQTTENDEYSTIGVFYYDPTIDFFSEDGYIAVGFVEICGEDAEYLDPTEQSSPIVVSSLTDESDNNLYVCTYTYEDIGYSHFVYEDKYVKYYQQTDMRVVYSVEDNIESNYDLSYGSLYDYDNKEYIFDEDIFSGYQTHSADSFLNDVEYKQLESELKSISDQQLENGYEVTQYDIVYISPESIQAYLDSEEQDTFFGYSVDSLTAALGLGTSLQMTENGLVRSEDADKTLEDYDWKKFLTKVGIGCGVIIVGAVVTYLTQGTAIACTIVYVTTASVTAGVGAGLGTFGIETAIGVLKGKSVEDSMKAATCKGLDAFSDTFLITAVILSAGCATGVVKPTACFPAGTLISVKSDNGELVYKPIEEISIGDYVLSYNESSGVVSYEQVTNTSRRLTSETVEVYLSGEKIKTTYEHPFYIADGNYWKAAGMLDCGDRLLSTDGEFNVIGTKQETIPGGVMVYNLTVDRNHTYFVGKTRILVHNECSSISTKRTKAVKEAWKREYDAVKNGTSKYNWTPDEIAQLLKDPKNPHIPGYEGHHILTVKELQGTVNESLIESADDIVFLNRAQHLLVHGGNTQNPTDLKVLVELLPWAEERVTMLLAMVS